MKQTLVMPILLMMITAIVFGQQAFADMPDFSKCAANPDHHCYSYKPGTNLHPTLGSAWSFDIFMPDGTCNVLGHMDNQGNCNVSQTKLSVPNYTSLQQNPGVFSVENIANAGSPSINYCPVGMFTLSHEDGYLSKVFNNQTGLDLTDFMYPSFCYAETGPNIINGKGGSATSPLSVITDKLVYSSGDILTIKGTAIAQSPDVTLMIISPTKNIVTVSQVTAIGGTFVQTIQTGGPLWQQTGIYTVKATQGTLSSSTNFTITSTVPEFPTAPVILVAIFSLVFVLGRVVDGHWFFQFGKLK